MELIIPTSTFNPYPKLSRIPDHCSCKVEFGTTTNTLIEGYLEISFPIIIVATLVFPYPVQATIVPLPLDLIHFLTDSSCRSSRVTGDKGPSLVYISSDVPTFKFGNFLNFFHFVLPLFGLTFTLILEAIKNLARQQSQLITS